MANQLPPQPQPHCQGESPEIHDQEVAEAGHRPDPNPNLRREQLCAVVLGSVGKLVDPVDLSRCHEGTI